METAQSVTAQLTIIRDARLEIVRLRDRIAGRAMDAVTHEVGSLDDADQCRIDLQNANIDLATAELDLLNSTIPP